MHAMDMISIVKFRPAETRLIAQRLYFTKMESLLNNILSHAPTTTHPFVGERVPKKRIALAVVSSDTGLCGVYNQEIIRLAEDFAQKIGRDNILLVAVGRKGFNYFRRRNYVIRAQFTEFHGRYSPEESEKVLKTLTDLFLSKEADEVYIVYAHFESIARHTVRLEKLLNIATPQSAQNADYLFEPDSDGILEKLIPLYLAHKMESILLNSFTTEHAMRMVAMRTATNNAKELVDNLTLLRNKLRQANITKEILEIISSVEAMR